MIKIYTDGSCLENPGNGGWAAIINENGNTRKISGNEKNTTNNRMELMAPINALKDMDPKGEIEIFTDSQYVKLGITEWINTWVKNNWKTSKKEGVKNKDLWLELYSLNKSLNVKTEKVNVPNQPLKALLSFKNINKVYHRLVKIDFDDFKKWNRNLNYKLRFDKIKNSKTVREWITTLPNDGDFREHSGEIKIDANEV